MKKNLISLVFPILVLAGCGAQPSEAETALKNFKEAKSFTIKSLAEMEARYYDQSIGLYSQRLLSSPVDILIDETSLDSTIKLSVSQTYKISDLLTRFHCETLAQLKAILEPAVVFEYDQEKDTATLKTDMIDTRAWAGYSEAEKQWIGYSKSGSEYRAAYLLDRELRTLFPKEDVLKAVESALSKGKFDADKEGYYIDLEPGDIATFASYTGVSVSVKDGYPISLTAYPDIDRINESGAAMLLGCPAESVTSVYNFSSYNSTSITLPKATPSICEKHNPVTAYEMTKDGHARYCTVCKKYLAVEAHHDHNEYGICTVCGHTETELIFGDKLFYNEENEPVYAYAYSKTSTGVKSHPILACDKNLNELSNCVEGLVDPDTSFDVTYRYYPDVDVLYVLDESQEAKTIESGHCYHAQEIEVKCYLDVGLSVGEEEGLIAPEGKSLKDYLGGLTPKCQERFTILDLEHDIETTEAPGEGCDVIYTETCHDCGEVTHQYTEKRHTYAFTKMLVSEFKSALLEEGCDQDIVDDMGALTDEYFVFGKLTCSKGDSTLFVILSKEDLDARESSDETIASIYLTEDDDAWVQELGFFAFPDIPLAN
jgi:hypothetical protein